MCPAAPPARPIAYTYEVRDGGACNVFAFMKTGQGGTRRKSKKAGERGSPLRGVKQRVKGKQNHPSDRLQDVLCYDKPSQRNKALRCI